MSLLEQELNQTRPIENPLEAAFLSVMKTADLYQRELELAVEAEGLTLQQYQVLRILRGAGERGLPVLEIAAQLIEGSPNVTRLVDRLAAKGLTERRRSTRDRRVVYAALTDSGRQALDRLQPAVNVALRQVCGGLTASETDQLIRLLERSRRAIYHHRERQVA